MKKDITYDEKDIIHINREALHREIRNILAEENVPDEYRVYMEMLEDMFTIAKASDELFKALEIINKQVSLHQSDFDRCRTLISDNDEMLEKWEQILLHKK